MRQRYGNCIICDINCYVNYSDVIMCAMASQITGVLIVYSTVCSDADQRTFQSFVFVRGIHRWPANSPHKQPVTRKMFPFDGAIMSYYGTETKPFTPLYHAATKRAKFWRQFQMHFLERNFCILIWVCSQGPSWQKLSIGWGRNLANKVT